MIHCDVVIIDSGINVNEKYKVRGVCIGKSIDGFNVTEDISDSIGHGSIICSIIANQASYENIFVIKLSNHQAHPDATFLIAALEYIKQNIVCRIVNISLGVKTSDDLSKLHIVCSELSSKGVVIVSAFSNDGSNSYPAAFDCVIGVDSKNDIKQVTDFDYVDSSTINILAKGNIQRLKMNDKSILFVSGSSIACAHITSILARKMDAFWDFQSALLYLKSKARYIYRASETEINKSIQPFPMKSAVIFPFSKEAHSFLRFSDMLPFYVKDYYDVRYSGKVGRKVASYFVEAQEDRSIKDIEKIDFAGVDSIILGHLDELNILLKRDYKLELIKKAIEMNVNIYSFDPLDKYLELLSSSHIKFFYPKVSRNNVPQNTFGKLHRISKPVVGIFGTSSRQGKFSLQLTLKREFECRDYRVGLIGTEPHSLLFGFDVVFPMGYNSTVQLESDEIVLYLNYEINKLCLQEKEIILVASQAQTVPFQYSNLMEFPKMQYHFVLGTKPDAIILCINYYDEISYIRNSIHVLMGLADSNVLALVMYPLTISNKWNGIHGEMMCLITNQEYLRKKKQLENEFNIPVFLLGEKQDMSDLCQLIIDYF